MLQVMSLALCIIQHYTSKLNKVFCIIQHQTTSNNVMHCILQHADHDGQIG